MRVVDAMSRPLGTIDAEASVADTAMEMSRQDVGCLAVVSRGGVVGVVSDRDLVVRAVSVGRDPGTTRVREIMTGDPVFCEPSDSLEEAATRMRENRIRRLIVRDRDGLPIGMLSVDDLAARAHDVRLAGAVLEDICASLRSPP